MVLMQQFIISLLLAIGCLGCASDKISGTYTAGFGPDNKKETFLIKDPSSISASLDAALPQLSRGAQPIYLKSRRPVYSLREALSDLQKIDDKPFVAMTEYKKWFWFATDVAPAGDARGPGAFLQGYAVQKGGFLAWKFN
jgi:hypothetical protein